MGKIKSRILLVDDSPLFLRQAKAMLEEKFDVSVATSAEKAILMLEKVVPSVILLDYEMPGTNGKDLFQTIRKMPQFALTPVLFLTSVADTVHIKEVLKLRPDGYILKPVAKAELIKRVSEANGEIFWDVD